MFVKIYTILMRISILAALKTFNAKNLHNGMLKIKNFSIENLDKAVAKIIFKPDPCLGFNWPPCQFRLDP